MKKAILVALITVFAALAVTAEVTAVLAEFSGKVEVKRLNGAWTPARKGMEIDLLDTVSTGFNSSALLRIGESTIQVQPLTRLTLDKLLEQAGTLSTNLFLKVGKVTTEVRSSQGIKQDFKIQSPYSTAAVRGTRFTFDGYSLNVEEGVVIFIPGPPKRDFTQYIERRLREKLQEAEEAEEKDDTEVELSLEALLEEILHELVSAGELDASEAESLKTELLALFAELLTEQDSGEGDEDGSDSGTDGTQQTDEDTGNGSETDSGDNPSTPVTKGTPTGPDDPDQPEVPVTGGISVEWEIPVDPTGGVTIGWEIPVDPTSGGLTINWDVPLDPTSGGLTIDWDIPVDPTTELNIGWDLPYDINNGQIEVTWEDEEQ